MSRAVLIECPDCKGKGKFTPAITCIRCNGCGAVPPPTPAAIGLKTHPCGTCGKPVAGFGCKHCEELSKARITLKEAAANYSAALLMSHANADVVLTALERLEAAAVRFTQIKEGK